MVAPDFTDLLSSSLDYCSIQAVRYFALVQYLVRSAFLNIWHKTVRLYRQEDDIKACVAATVNYELCLN